MQELKIQEFDWLKITLANPDNVLEWSYGEVENSETKNYRTQKSERGGLFDEKIFGPEKDFECYCGKYKGIRYKGIVCEKCGVEITKSIVRRRRMGHIELATPVAHIWYLRSIPSRMSLILNIPMADLEKVIYYSGHIITEVDKDDKKKILIAVDEEYKSKIKDIEDEKMIDQIKEIFLNTKADINKIIPGVVLDEIKYLKYSSKFPELFKVEIGAEAIYKMMQKISLKRLLTKLEKEMDIVPSTLKQKMSKRIHLIKSMISSEVKPEWMFVKRIPVTPPALRPIVALGGGKMASSDVNDLYRRVINRNNRLKRLLEIDAPDVILRNEKRILQEAVDALLDNSMRRSSASAALSAAQRRPLKSLAEAIKGKQGIFRQNLLGKRVDYSGRSVIVVGPELRIDETGLPKLMALELFRPFVISRLIAHDLAHNIKVANKMVDEGSNEVWEFLEEVIQNKYVLLNRAPTLHKLGILAFKPVLTEGQAIRLHPLVCSGFNADFDGDSMAVHLPISIEAQKEAEVIMSSAKNVLKPGNNELIVNSKLDIVLGAYWATKFKDKAKGEGKIFPSPNDAINAYDFEIIDFKAKIKVLGTANKKYNEYTNEVFETSVGRLLFNSYLPSEYPFLNKTMDQKTLKKLEDDLIAVYGIHKIPKILDDIKDFGFKYATKSGTTWSNVDLHVPEKKKIIIDATEKEVRKNWEAFNEGFITKNERKRKNIELWFKAKDEVDAEIVIANSGDSSVTDMSDSGARGSRGNLSTMIGMKGIVSNVLNEGIEFPVKSSIKEGLDPIEYFITTHGSRKGLADTALNTAKAGYLTRKLFDVGQDVIINEEDCQTNKSITISTNSIGFKLPLSKTCRGRYITKTVKDNEDNIIFKKGHFLTIADANKLDELEIEQVEIRSPLTCQSVEGICQKCFGMDMGGDQLVDLGETVGTMAAQAIGEPGTQLTMRTKHVSGAASRGGDIVSGLPRVEEIFERRKPKVPAVIAKEDGEVFKIEDEGQKTLITIQTDETVGKSKTKERIYVIPFLRTPIIKEGEKIKKGQLLTDGAANLEELLKLGGKEVTQEYIISETVKIYELQGSSVARKHMEVIIKQMFSRSKVINIGDSEFIDGDIVENAELEKINEQLKNDGKAQVEAELLILGISEVSLSRKSFLSAASFQYTVKMLINASLRGAVDPLKGLKENVIVGGLIPAGTNFKGSKKYEIIQEVQKIAAAEEEEERKRE